MTNIRGYHKLDDIDEDTCPFPESRRDNSLRRSIYQKLDAVPKIKIAKPKKSRGFKQQDSFTCPLPNLVTVSCSSFDSEQDHSGSVWSSYCSDEQSSSDFTNDTDLSLERESQIMLLQESYDSLDCDFTAKRLLYFLPLRRKLDAESKSRARFAPKSTTKLYFSSKPSKPNMFSIDFGSCAARSQHILRSEINEKIINLDETSGSRVLRHSKPSEDKSTILLESEIENVVRSSIASNEHKCKRQSLLSKSPVTNIKQTENALVLDNTSRASDKRRTQSLLSKISSINLRTTPKVKSGKIIEKKGSIRPTLSCTAIGDGPQRKPEKSLNTRNLGLLDSELFKDVENAHITIGRRIWRNCKFRHVLLIPLWFFLCTRNFRFLQVIALFVMLKIFSIFIKFIKQVDANLQTPLQEDFVSLRLFASIQLEQLKEYDLQNAQKPKKFIVFVTFFLRWVRFVNANRKSEMKTLEALFANSELVRFFKSPFDQTKKSGLFLSGTKAAMPKKKRQRI